MSELVEALVASAVVTQIAVLSTTVYLHRAATHSALELHPVVAWLFRFALWLTTGIRTKEWVAVHLKHHAFADEEGDPHSPKLFGFWSVQFGNVFHYVKERKNQDTLERYGSGITEDVWDEKFFNHGIPGVVTGTAILCLGLGWWGLLAAALHGLIYVFVLSSSINGLCHKYGRKNFENTATNVQTVAFLTAGEGLHNNHHGFPSSPKFSYKPWEFDPAWSVIRVLKLCGLAKTRKTIAEMV